MKITSPLPSGQAAGPPARPGDVLRHSWLRDLESALLSAPGDRPHRQGPSDRQGVEPAGSRRATVDRGAETPRPTLGAPRHPAAGHLAGAGPRAATASAGEPRLHVIDRRLHATGPSGLFHGPTPAATGVGPELGAADAAIASGATWPGPAPTDPAAQRRLHITPRDDGVDVWIRDAALQAPQARAVVAGVLAALQELHVTVHRASVNGRLVHGHDAGATPSTDPGAAPRPTRPREQR